MLFKTQTFINNHLENNLQKLNQIKAAKNKEVNVTVQNKTYLDKAEQFFDDDKNATEFSWDEKTIGKEIISIFILIFLILSK